MYYYLITEDSIEEKILETLKQRKNYTDELFRKQEDQMKEKEFQNKVIKFLKENNIYYIKVWRRADFKNQEYQI